MNEKIEKIKEKLMKDLYMGKYTTFKRACKAIDKVVEIIKDDYYQNCKD